MFSRHIAALLSGLAVFSAAFTIPAWSQGKFVIGSPQFQSLTMNSGISSAAFQVTASPSGSVSFNISSSSSEPWFTLATNSSNCSAAGFTLQATTPANLVACVNTNKVRFGVYSSLLTVAATSGNYPQARLPVSVTVFPPSEIKASTSSVALSSSTLQQTVFLSYQGNNGDNSSTASISVVAPDPAAPPEGSWLLPTNNCSGVVLNSSGNSCPIVIAASPVQLTAGVVGQTYSGRVVVESVRGDRADVDVSFSYTQAVAPPLSITSGTSFTATAGQSYTASLSANGGTPPYTWKVTGLSDGFTYSSTTGQISGTPATAGNINASVVVQDSAGNQAGPQQITIQVQTGQVVTQLFPHLADGGEWQMEFLLANPSSSPTTVELRFHLDGGAAGLSVNGGANTTDIPNIALASNGSVVFRTAGSASAPLVTGWAEVLSATPVSGQALFRRHAGNGGYYEGSVPLTAPVHGFTLPVDGTSFTDGTPFYTGIGIANTDASVQAQISCAVYNSSGAQLTTNASLLNLAPKAHTQLILQNAPPVQNFLGTNRGLLVCTSNTGVGVLGLRFFGNYALSSVPTF
ncbi:MAG: hypothetical protein JO323_13125 [Acidobacteriia bacterium]|nr:hypothetical protein [Terriglobia bacterium]